MLWVVGMANAINLIDGLDGLAAGIVAIAAGAFFLYGHRLADAERARRRTTSSPLLAVLVLGICLGFLPHNFHPARIFMGDGGALLLGLLMASSTMLVGGQTDDPVQRPVVLLLRCRCSSRLRDGRARSSTPLFAIVRRATQRLGLADADKDHLHHRLMRLGHGQRRSVLILWAWTALLSGFVLYPVVHRAGATPSCRSGIAALGLCCTRSSTPAVRRARERGAAED